MEYSYTPEELTENLLKYHPEIKSYVENGDTPKVLNIRKQNKNNPCFKLMFGLAIVSGNLLSAMEIEYIYI